MRRVNEIAFVEHVDHVITDDQYNAFGKVIQAQADGRELDGDYALHEAARDRLKPLPHPDRSNRDND